MAAILSRSQCDKSEDLPFTCGIHLENIKAHLYFLYVSIIKSHGQLQSCSSVIDKDQFTQYSQYRGLATQVAKASAAMLLI